MKEVLFVGDMPSKRNTDPTIAFDGTASGKRLETWIKYLEVKRYTKVNMFNSPKKVNSFAEKFIDNFVANKKPIVALGNNASNALSKRGVYHFKIPHPSGRNRILNNNVIVRFYLDVCKLYIQQE